MIKPLTSLRFFFAVAVFLSHYIWNNSSIFADGYIGVSFFFILSGFILAFSYKDKMSSGSVSIKSFYIARIARIYPLHILTFIVSLSLSYIALNPPQGSVALLNLMLLQSWVPIEGVYFSINAPSWSISDEAFFYLIFPLTIFFITKLKRIPKISIFTAILIAYIISTILINNKENIHAFFYVNPLFRLIDFILGIALFILWNNHKSKIENLRTTTSTILEITAISLLICMIYLSGNIPKTYTYAGYYWIPMMIVIFLFASLKNGLISKLLSLRPFVIAGEISFGFYMWHVPIIHLTQTFLHKTAHLIQITIPQSVEFIIVFCAIFVVSILSFYYFETPANKFIRKIGPRIT